MDGLAVKSDAQWLTGAVEVFSVTFGAVVGNERDQAINDVLGVHRMSRDVERSAVLERPSQGDLLRDQQLQGGGDLAYRRVQG